MLKRIVRASIMSVEVFHAAACKQNLRYSPHLRTIIHRSLVYAELGFLVKYDFADSKEYNMQKVENARCPQIIRSFLYSSNVEGLRGYPS